MELTMQFLLAVWLAYVLLEFFIWPQHCRQQVERQKFAAPCLYWRALLLSLGFTLLAVYVVGVSSLLFGLSLVLLLVLIVLPAWLAYLPPSTFYYLFFQALQFVILGLAVVAVSDAWQGLNSLFGTLMQPKVLLLVLAYLLILNPCSRVLALALRPWNPAVQQAGLYLPMAGKAIGMVERSLILSCVLLDQTAAIGFIIAAKSIFRFGDLTGQSERKLTEYVLLGTLLSVAMSVFIGLAAHAGFVALS